MLDSTTRHLFESSIAQNSIPTFDVLLKFVQNRCKVLENLKPVEKFERTDKSRGKSSVFTTTTSTPNKSVAKDCLMCGQSEHNIYRCPNFNRLSVEKRREIVASRRLCFACLNPNHMAKACPSKNCCRSCSSKQHHTLLHIDSIQSSSTGTDSGAQLTSLDDSNVS